MNRCYWCNKFRKWEELSSVFTPDNEFSGEDIYYECVHCISKRRDSESVVTEKDLAAYG